MPIPCKAVGLKRRGPVAILAARMRNYAADSVASDMRRALLRQKSALAGRRLKHVANRFPVKAMYSLAEPRRTPPVCQKPS